MLIERPLQLALPFLPGALSRSTDRCKALPNTPSWPSQDAWNQLNGTLDGQLITVIPPGAVCHPNLPTFDNTTCTLVQTAWATYEFHASDPVSTDWQNWNNDTCLPNPRAPCSAQGYPAYVINATTAEHVQIGVKFAAAHNVRLVVKASGHDFHGRSIAPHALSIWTANMDGITLHPADGFQPRGCAFLIPGTSLTAKAGTTNVDLVNATAPYNLTVVGGGGRTVNIGGYHTGGGHSLLGPTFGMAADQVLEMEIVTPHGQILTINECQNSDLFWAMRGGGGSTFGIMTSLTIKTHPSLPLVGITAGFGTVNLEDPALYEVAAYIFSNYPRLSDAGISGYSFISINQTLPVNATATIQVAGVLCSFALVNSTDLANVASLFDPILQHVNSTWPIYFPIFETKPYASYAEWYSDNYDQTPAGGDMFVGSHLLDEHALTSNLTALAEAYRDMTLLSNQGSSTAYLVGGKGVRDAQPRGGGNSIHPGWRTAHVHATNGASVPPLNLTARQESLQSLNASLVKVRALAPSLGAYVNEAYSNEPDWQTTFWGDNYPQLLEIKRQVDPDDVLWCHPCVGNERWQVEGDALCRV